jgi:hypothetical protein
MAISFVGIRLVFGVEFLVLRASSGFFTLPTALVLQVFDVGIFHPSDPADFR